MKETKSRISLKQLQALEAVARHGSFTLAAKELGVSQPTVSNLIYSLEQQYKCRLFDRGGSEIRPTSILSDIRGQVKAIIALQDALDSHLSAGRDLQSGKFKIGYTTYQLAMPIVSAFVQSYPGIDVTARAMSTHDLLPLLFEGEFDAGFMTGTELPPELDGIEIAPARIGLVFPSDHPLANRESVDWSDLKDMEFIQREPSSGTRRVFEAAARVANANPRTTLGLGSWGSILALVRSGVGIGVGFEAEFVSEEALVFVPINDRNLNAKHFLICLPAMRQTSMVEELFRIAQEICDGFVSSSSA